MIIELFILGAYVIEKYELLYHKDDVQFSNKRTATSCQFK